MPVAVQRGDAVADQLQSTKHAPPEDQSDNPRWRIVYGAVIAFAALIILSLFLFSRHFSG